MFLAIGGASSKERGCFSSIHVVVVQLNPGSTPSKKEVAASGASPIRVFCTDIHMYVKKIADFLTHALSIPAGGEMQFSMKHHSTKTSLCVALCSGHARQTSTNMLQVIAADLDGDGDHDLVSINRESSRVVWYENLLVQVTPSPFLVATASPSQTPASSIDSTARLMKPRLIKGGGDIIATGPFEKHLLLHTWFALRQSRAAHDNAPLSDWKIIYSQADFQFLHGSLLPRT